jgi:hypothetical protein
MMKKKVKGKKRVKRKKERVTNMSGKQKKQVSFYAKASDVKSAFYANQPIFVLLYKEACFNTNELDESLPNVVVSLLQEYEDMFPNDVPSGLPPIRGIEHQIDLYQVRQFLTDQPIRVIRRKQRNFKGKLRS